MSAMPITENIADILHITGAITAAMLAQFLAPQAFLRHIVKIEMPDEASAFYARHWGLLAFVIGASLMYAGAHPEVRYVVVMAALVEKAGFAALVVRDFNRPFARGLRVAAIFDIGCVLLYGIFLSHWA